MAKHIVIAIAALTMASACGGNGQSCTPGQSISCSCTDGRMGAQVCGSDGTYAVCNCSGSRTGNPGTGGSGGSGGSGGDMAGTSTGGAKRVFVTSLAYATTAAPSVCQNAADAVGLGGKWTAWLSDYSDDAISLIQGNGPWNLLTGATAFANHAQLATMPTTAIGVTENGTTLTGNTDVWSGTLAGGTRSNRTCSSWTDGSSGSALSGGATVGSSLQTSGWTNYSSSPCNVTAHVYCFEN